MTLRGSIVLLLTGLLVGAFFLIGSVGYVTTYSSVETLRRSLLTQIDKRVQQEMQDYFDSAEPALSFMERAVFLEMDFMRYWEKSGRLLARYLETQPNLVWMYYAEESTGNLLGTVYDADTNRYLITYIHERNDRLSQSYQVFNDGFVRPTAPRPGEDQPYDPRERPWYERAVASEGVIWTAPYDFLSRNLIGITAARARRGPDGNVLGVYAVDFTLQGIAQFLDDFEVGETGAAFLMLEDGSFVVEAEERQNPNIPELQEALKSQSWKELQSLETGMTLEREFRSDGVSYVALMQPIDLPGTTRYFATVIVPEADFLGMVTRNSWMALFIGLAVLLAAIGLGTWFAKRVTEPLAAISDELESIGNLRFREQGLYLRSNIREVALFNDSVGKMKISLRAFSRYVPRDLVRQLLAQGDEAQLGGRLQKLTVVFTDLAGFTKMSEEMSPNDAFAELSAFLEVVADTQQEYGGITSTFTGDGTLALFNAPDELENHESNAVQAALDCVSTLDKVNESRRKAGKPEFFARIGVNTADVLLGNLGTQERFAYTAIGDGVNLASRLESLNKFYGTHVLVGEECQKATGEEFEWRHIDRISVFGRNQPTDIYEPLGRQGKVDKTVLKAKAHYEKGLHYYFEEQFSKARAEFEAAREFLPQDNASNTMLKRCDEYAHHGPPKGWDGVFAVPFK